MFTCFLPLKEGHCSCNCGVAIEFVLPLVQHCQQCLEQQWICCLGNDVCCHCCHSVRIWMGVVHKAEISSHSQTPRECYYSKKLCFKHGLMQKGLGLTPGNGLYYAMGTSIKITL